RVEAMRRFGDRWRIEQQLQRIDRTRELTMWRARVVLDLSQDMRLALRQVRRRPGHAAVAVGILALGIGASVAAFAGVDGALLRSLPLPDDHSLVYVSVVDPRTGEGGYSATLPDFRDWERDADFFEAVTAMASNRYVLTGDGEPQQVTGLLVAGDPLGVMRLRPTTGRSFSPEELQAGARVVMLGEMFWRQQYGAERNVIGRAIRVDGAPYTVIGVMPRAANLLRGGRPLELWLPLEEQEWMDRSIGFLSVAGRLREGMTLSTARSRTATLAASLREAGVTSNSIGLAEMRTELVGETRAVLWLLLGAAGFLLLIVCANVANLFLAQALRRANEFAVRTALGAGRMRLARQVMTESLVLALAGGVAGFGVAHAASDLLTSVSIEIAALFPRSLLDLRVVGFTVATSLFVAVLFGVWPAWRIGRGSVAGVMKGAGGVRAVSGRRSWLRRRLLVGFEVALSVVLLAGAGLLMRSVMNLLEEDKGFSCWPSFSACAGEELA
ncbi:MAG: ABC transporter permease, partial [Longimicrobiales bacterium]